MADDFGHGLTFGYTGDLLTSVADSAGRSISYGYDADKNLTAYTDPENKVWNLGYDGVHRILTLTTESGDIIPISLANLTPWGTMYFIWHAWQGGYYPTIHIT